jgi:serine/threonine-protein kinase
VSPGTAQNQPSGGAGLSQSQIETALSLPRPDAADIWAAQQDAAAYLGQRRNTVVLVAVVALTALCVIGIGALVYMKTQAPRYPTNLHGATSSPESVDTERASYSGAAGTSVRDELSASPRPVSASPGAKRALAEPEEKPGYLTVVCSPGCDEVFDGSDSLGSPPLHAVAMRPGPHKITVRRGAETKVLDLVITPGQTSLQRVTMPQ